jgi:hypothetical protein
VPVRERQDAPDITLDYLEFMGQAYAFAETEMRPYNQECVTRRDYASEFVNDAISVVERGKHLKRRPLHAGGLLCGLAFIMHGRLSRGRLTGVRRSGLAGFRDDS